MSPYHPMLANSGPLVPPLATPCAQPMPLQRQMCRGDEAQNIFDSCCNRVASRVAQSPLC
eukprot:1161556-Pelagomonas_calceolata.AAC.5